MCLLPARLSRLSEAPAFETTASPGPKDKKASSTTASQGPLPAPLSAEELGTLRQLQVSLAEVRAKEPDLTERQLAILLTIYLDPPPHTVRGLAGKLDVSKPVITRALDTMGALKLVSRHRDPNDRRNVLIKRTVEGALFVERFGDVVVAKSAELPL